MTEAPDLAEPYRDDDERAAGLVGLLVLDRRLAEWRQLSRAPVEEWPTDRLEVLAGAPPFFRGDTPETRLRRWAALFDDELQVVRQARNRLVHGVPPTDAELRGAVWMAKRLLALLEPEQPGAPPPGATRRGG